MAADRLRANILYVRLHGLLRNRSRFESLGAKTHNNDVEGRWRGVTERVRYRPWKIDVILLGQRYADNPVFDGAAPLQHDIHLVLLRILNAGARAVGIDAHFAETRYAHYHRPVAVAFTEERLVMTGARGEIGFL